MAGPGTPPHDLHRRFSLPAMEHGGRATILKTDSTKWVDRGGDPGKLVGLPRNGVRESGSCAVGVRFLRTQQRVKSQCLY